jgi:hypothetical protein
MELSSIDKCALTGFSFKKNEIKPIAGPVIEYENEYAGKVKITLSAYQEIQQYGNVRYIIAGICKNRTLQKQEPILIDTEFIKKGYLSLKPPLEFSEKCYSFLKTIYHMGGKENVKFRMTSFEDFALAYSTPEEFIRIIDQLETDYFISIDNKSKTLEKHEFYFGLKLTNYGKEEVEKVLPKMPMYGLVNQIISTGNIEIDDQINHARELFFADIPTLEKMRSACETLSYVLESLKDDLAKYFTQKDVKLFFQLVNTFDIRHNKNSTINLVEEEQLEWIFYTLLNTITMYNKLKQKGK